MTTPFDAAAWVASGKAPRPAARQQYHLRVTPQRLQLQRTGIGGTVLDVPMGSFRVRPIGAAGSCVIELEGASVCIDFSEHEAGTVARARFRRVGRALRGRRTRRAFLSAAKGSP